MEKSFYTILKFVPNKATNDSIALALVLYYNGLFYSYFSNDRLRLANKLLPEISVKILISQFQDKLIEINEREQKNKNKLIPNFEDYFKSFEYLSDYSNGLISFESPKVLSEKFKIQDFEKLCNYFFPNDLESIEKRNELQAKEKNFDSIVREKLINKVKSVVNTDYTFTPKILSSIYFDYELDCIGKNGALIGAKSMLFDQTDATIDKKISHYIQLITLLSNKYSVDLNSNLFYLITEEPAEINSKNHQIWESVNNNPIINLIHPEESEKIVNEIDRRKAKAFLDI